jgi:hypothetical protein
LGNPQLRPSDREVFLKVFKDLDFVLNISVSEDGVIIDNTTGVVKKPYIDQDGYERTGLKVPTGGYKNFYVHRLVALAFIPNPENKPQVNHKDSNRRNNKVSNLEWVTAKENTTHGILFGNIKLNGEDSSVSVYTNDTVHSICKSLEEDKLSLLQIAKLHKVHKTLVDGIKCKTSWRHISSLYNIPETRKKLNKDAVHSICAMLQDKLSYKQIIESLPEYDLNRHILRHIKNRNTFKNIVKNYNW